MLNLRDREPLARGQLAVVGLPYDENSSFMQGAALAPPRIRRVLHAGSMNLCAENGIDLAAEPRYRDLGNLEFGSDCAPSVTIHQTVSGLLDQGLYVLALGGDHAITYPILKAYSTTYPGLNVLHLDAHPDLYEEFDGSRFSHACPFARIMEENLVRRLVQVGIRTLNPHQHAQAKRFGVEIIEMVDWQPGLKLVFDGPVYISVDLDVLDPAYAPGVSHHEPGGMSTRELIGLIHSLCGPVVGADIVEFNPRRDPVGITAMVAAKLLKEIAASIIVSTQRSLLA
jgi:agmatinase